MKNRRILSLLLISALVVAAIFFLSMHDEPPSSNQQRPHQLPEVADQTSVTDEPLIPFRVDFDADPVLSGFVGSEACRDCHAEIFAQYQSNPMAQSFARIENALPIENYTDHLEFHPPGSRQYRVEQRGREVLHHEIMLDSAGEMIYDQAVPVTYSLGSGKRGRAYVIDHDGLLFKSSISWYSDTRSWGLSPDYLPASHMRFERRMTGGCLACHSGLPNFTRLEPDRFKEPPFLEDSIGCERCHGPGQKHLAFRNSEEQGDDPIVNPSRLDMDRREAICAQCHLRGEARILRSGRTPHDFRPGERLEDNWIIFVKSQGGGLTRSGRAATQAEHMVSSVCFQRSEGRLGCTSCHDPHGIPAPAERDTFYRQKCLKCHQDQGCALPAAEREAPPHLNRCTECHMPSINAANVLHRSVADHRILRTPIAVEDEVEPSESVIFQFSPNPIPEFELQRAKALKMAQDALESEHSPDFVRTAMMRLTELVGQKPDDPEFYVALGNCALILNRPRQAEKYWTEVLRINPRHEPTIQALAALYQDNLQMQPAENALKQFVALNPWHGSFYGRLAGVSLYRGDARAAIAAAERGLELNPHLSQLHEFLAEVYANSGNQELAAKHRNLLNRMREVESQAPGGGK